MKYFLIAGEASGDLHASNLMAKIKEVDNQADFMFFGGDLMQAQGGKMLRHYREMAYMGVIEVVANLGKIKKNFEICYKNLLEYKPDAVILVDYPGFNLKIAKFAKQHGFKTFYYISPKIWAWKKNRAYTIKKYVDKMFAIFPFEVDFYKQFNYQVQYVGNPLVDAMKNREKDFVDLNEFRKKHNLSDLPIIALVPGSRKSEIQKLLPEMIGIIPHFLQYQFVITGAPGIDHDFYDEYTQNKNVTVVFDDTYNVIKNAEVAVVTSGTATLETAFLKTPQVVVYKMNYISYLAAKTFVKIKYFSLVNIILNRLAVKELLQAHLTDDIVNELQKILLDQLYKQKMLKSYDEIQNILCDQTASLRTAEVIFNDINNL